MSVNSTLRSRCRLRLAMLVIAAIAPFAAFIAYQIGEICERRASEALQRALQFARIGADGFETTSAEARGLLELIERMPEAIGGAPERCRDALTALASARRWANGIWIVGPNGRVRCSTVANGVGVDLSDRPEYRQALAAGSFSVSDFFVGKLRPIPMAIAALPAPSESGETILLAVTIDLSWFDRLSATIGEHAAATILLLDSKGAILSTYPAHPASIGQRVADHAGLSTILQGTHGRFEGKLLDNTRAFWGYVKLAGSDLRLVVGFDRAAVLANVNRGTRHALVIFALVSLGISALIWFAGHSFFANPLRELDELLHVTLDTMHEGLIVVDKHGTLPICNRRAMELLDLPAELMSTRPTSTAVIAYQEARGEFAAVSEQIKPRLHPRAIGEVRNVYERVRPNGTVLEIHTVPLPGGGVVRTYADVTARKQVERTLERLVNFDGLTGLANRRHLDANLAAEIGRARRDAGDLALVMLDVDYFKAYNDRYGHLAGDGCLKDVARVVQEALQRPADFAARYGGEEIAVVLPGSDLAGGMAVAEKIRLAVRRLNIAHEGSPRGHLSVSAGVTSFAVSGVADHPEEFIKYADRALYKAKRNGRDCVEPYSPNDIPADAKAA